MSNDLTPHVGEISALLGRGTEYKGKLTFEGRVRVDGRFEGEVFSEGILIVGEGASIDATIDVGTLIVLGGVVRGAIRARELVELHAPCSVLGDIETERIFIGEGVHFEGRCQMNNGGASERHALGAKAPEAPPASGPSPDDTSEASPDDPSKASPAEVSDASPDGAAGSEGGAPPSAGRADDTEQAISIGRTDESE
jgi:cytoskeletal protein CcmA (bactofilin family)